MRLEVAAHPIDVDRRLSVGENELGIAENAPTGRFIGGAQLAQA
jgi:hypothetical protein